MKYRYGMLHARGFGPGCQPREGLLGREDSPTRKYSDIIVYDRKLSDKEVYSYELESIDKM